MKITIEVDEKEIEGGVKEILVEKMSAEIFGKYKLAAYNYKTSIKECIREAIRPDIENLKDRAVEAAAVTITNRAIKDKLKKSLEDI